MDIEHPEWETYENRFRALAEQVSLKKGPQPELASAQSMLFLYGENGLKPEEEFAMLAKLEKAVAHLQGTTMQTAYWEDIVLYIL